MRHTHFAAAAALGILLQGCAPVTPAFQAGPNAEVTHDGLTRVDNTRLQAVWLRPDIDLTPYTGMILENAGVEFRPVQSRVGTSDAYPITESDKERFVELVSEEFRSSLSESERFEIVTAPGPDVLLVRGSLLDVISNVPPRDSGRTQAFLQQVAEATLVIEVYDSQSGAILARAAERRVAEDLTGRATRVYSGEGWEQVRDLARLWARTLREGLEELATTGFPGA
jgi:hypothetical protein